ncbi:uncharacterized protein [Triticum aestivum]|uniref:uncharacterized protein isoform X2 n=1 Tax=Triticum aestivum TaxID=4565 RepID=UPI001ABCF4DA|nr:uncharacterized protein LOC109773440 isoform X1 [Aegilops tauschii subsp. strangulata]XP_044451166.1 uncharacterized protein LOC123182599 isoform X2 [Triticum aestivum]
MDMRMRVSVISAPRLVTLGYISQNSQDSKIMFGSTVIQRLHVVSLTTVVRTVKILAVHMNFNLDMVIDLMKCFVCLEKLYMKIQTDSPAGANFWRHKHRNFLTSQDIRLKTLVLGHYRGIQAQVNFVTFFILNAKLLESIRLEVDSRDYNDGFFAEQCRMLQMENRISRGAQLCVTQVLTMMFRAPLTSMIWIWLIRSHVDVESGPGSWLSYSCVSHLVFLPKLENRTKRRWPESAIL